MASRTDPLQKKKNSAPSKTPEQSAQAEQTAASRKARRRDPERILNQVMPYLLGLAAIFMILCYLFRSRTGPVGDAIVGNLCGIFGIAAVAIPFFLLNLAVFWRRDRAAGIMKWKCISTLLCLILVSVLLYLPFSAQFPDSLTVKEIYTQSRAFQDGGGGVVGDVIGRFAVRNVGKLGTVFLSVALLLIFFPYLLGTTPRRAAVALWSAAFGRKKHPAPEEESPMVYEKPRQTAFSQPNPTYLQSTPTAYDRTGYRDQPDVMPFNPDIPLPPRKESQPATAGAEKPQSPAPAAQRTPQASVQTEKPVTRPSRFGTSDNTKSQAPRKSAHERLMERENTTMVIRRSYVDSQTPQNLDATQTAAQFFGGYNPQLDPKSPQYIGNPANKTGQSARATSIAQDRNLQNPQEAAALYFGGYNPQLDPKSPQYIKPNPKPNPPTSIAQDRNLQNPQEAAALYWGGYNPRLDPKSPDYIKPKPPTPAEPITVTSPMASMSPKAEEPDEEEIAPVLAQNTDQPEHTAPSASQPTYTDSVSEPKADVEKVGMEETEEVEAEPEDPIEPPFTPSFPPAPQEPVRLTQETVMAEQVPTPLDGAALFAQPPRQDTSYAMSPVTSEAPPAPPRVPYDFPPISCLSSGSEQPTEDISAELQQRAQTLMETLESFHVSAQITHVSRGPTVTRYELVPDRGVRVNQILNLENDIAMNLAASGKIRIEAPIVGKCAIGIEVPNQVRSVVYMRKLIETEAFQNSSAPLLCALGEDVAGAPVFMNLEKMPHLLVAGATGMGKSVCINCILASILYRCAPEDVNLILIDPKKVEFTLYDGLPHLRVPVVTDAKKAAGALEWAVGEMTRRYSILERAKIRNIGKYNQMAAKNPDWELLPRVVIVIDELASLMMVARDAVEDSICRLLAEARAAGIHVILGTQRPSVDVITGLLKSNIPSRIAFACAAQQDSRTILGTAGAEKLLGKGDMLYAPVDVNEPVRLQGAFISEEETEAIVRYICSHNGKGSYDDEVISAMERTAAALDKDSEGDSGHRNDLTGDNRGRIPDDEVGLLKQAVEMAVNEGSVSASNLQIYLRIGFQKAKRLLVYMERKGMIAPAEGQKPRETKITREEYQELLLQDDVWMYY